jgi:hypothetical protein
MYQMPPGEIEGHERLDRRGRLQSCLQRANVALNLGLPVPGDGARAGRRVRRRFGRSTAEKLGKLLPLERLWAWLAFALETGQAIFDIRRVANLADLAVIDNVDAMLELHLDDLQHCLAHTCVQDRAVVERPRIMAIQQLDQIIGSRQAARMAGENAVGAA